MGVVTCWQMNPLLSLSCRDRTHAWIGKMRAYNYEHLSVMSTGGMVKEAITFSKLLATLMEKLKTLR